MNRIQFPSIPPALNNYTWRPAEINDAPALHQLFLDIEAVDQRGYTSTLDERKRDFQDPECHTPSDSILAIAPSGEVAASGWIFSPPPTEREHLIFLWGEVHPSHRQRGLGHYLLSWMEWRGAQILAARPVDMPHAFRCSCMDNLSDRIELLETNGYQQVRSYYRMRRDLSAPIPDWSIPPEVRFTLWQLERNREVLDVFNATFQDHWGFIPADEKIWNLFLTGHPDFRPDLSWLALAVNSQGEEQVIGFSLNQVHEADNAAEGILQGWIQDLGVLRSWRKRGIASGLLCASMQSFKDAGLDYAALAVDTENLTGALHLYERLGFIKFRRSLAYGKTISTPHQASIE